ncbi:hypothetical protein SeMB42_g07537 [Synchytrium endobioticum]|uniref:Uncharacterized protein n=1 Tax=Synchytrium endobioticum TaxID=286115 RepID=A0A507BW19_9FUNG|nr:hypothetical protein SeMB42_g07537 [Synchytrium endobioticum]TPX42266.1 hypothetical protein SeLEV6574_g05683 [Synchytrium endobioticum]
MGTNQDNERRHALNHSHSPSTGYEDASLHLASLQAQRHGIIQQITSKKLLLARTQALLSQARAEAAMLGTTTSPAVYAVSDDKVSIMVHHLQELKMLLQIVTLLKELNGLEESARDVLEKEVNFVKTMLAKSDAVVAAKNSAIRVLAEELLARTRERDMLLLKAEGC